MATLCSLARGLASLGLLVAAAGCDVSFHAQEVRLRYAEEADEIDALIVTYGLQQGASLFESESAAFALAEAALADFVSLQRHFALWVFPLGMNLEPWLAEPCEAPPGPEREDELRARELLADLRVTDAGAFLDASGRLAVWQRVHMARVQDWVALANRATQRAAFLPELEGADREQRIAHLREELPFLERADAELWLEHVEAERAWFALQDGRVSVFLPLTRAGAGRAMQAELCKAAEPNVLPDVSATVWLGHMLAQLHSIEEGPAGLTLTFAPLADGEWVFQSGETGEPYDARLLEAWRASDGALSETDAERLRAGFRGR